MIAEVERGFYAVSFAGGQVDPATGDFVFGVSEGYLIENGEVTSPCRGATLIGNCLEALAAIDAVGEDFFMKTGICGKGGQRVPVGTGQGHVRVGAMTVGGTAGLSELSATAGRAVEATLGGWRGRGGGLRLPRDSGREVRVHGGEVESLTAATQTRGRRPRLDWRAGRLRLRDRPLRGRRRGDRRPRRRGRPGRRRGRVRGARRSRPHAEPLAGPQRSLGRLLPRPSRSPSWPWRRAGGAGQGDPRVAAVEQAVYADSSGAGRDRLLGRRRRRVQQYGSSSPAPLRSVTYC